MLNIILVAVLLVAVALALFYKGRSKAFTRQSRGRTFFGMHSGAVLSSRKRRS